MQLIMLCSILRPSRMPLLAVIFQLNNVLSQLLVTRIDSMWTIVVGPEGHQSHTTIARLLDTIGMNSSKGPAKHISQQFKQADIIDIGPVVPGLAVRSRVRILLVVINKTDCGKAAAMPWAPAKGIWLWIQPPSQTTDGHSRQVCAALSHHDMAWRRHASCLTSYFGIICQI